MSLLKESALPAAIRRLTPPSSPSKHRALSHTATKSPYKSKILAALDAQFSSRPLHTAMSKVATEATQKDIKAIPIHPYFQRPIKAPKFADQNRQPREDATDVGRPDPSSSTSTSTSTASSRGTPFAKLQAIAETLSEMASGEHKPPPQSRSRQRPRVTYPSQLKYASQEPPFYSYQDYKPRPTVVYTQHEEEANDLIETLKGPLGFDMEWPVFFRRGVSPIHRKTALVQLCDERTILLIHVSQMKMFPKKLREVLENPMIPKMGVNILNDGKKLYGDFGVACANLVELGALAHNADPVFSEMYNRQIVSLARMVKMYTNRVLDKPKERTSDWSQPQLTKEQMEYAANDTHSGLMVYQELLHIAQEKGQILQPSRYSFAVSRELTEVPAPNSAAPNKSELRSDEITSELVSRQHMRAYMLWHKHQLPLDEIRAELRSKENPLAKSTVISYVVAALIADPALRFDVNRLETLVRHDYYSWKRWQNWIWKLRREQSGEVADQQDGQTSEADARTNRTLAKTVV